MSDRLPLLLSLICLSLLGVSGEDSMSNDNKKGGVWCQECLIVKNMDNQVKDILDEVTHTVVNSCKEYQCEASEDWCLVTYYRNAAEGNSAQFKHEIYECGNKSQRDSDYRCNELRKEDSQSRIQYCRTQRSGASDSMFAVSLSVLISILFVILY